MTLQSGEVALVAGGRRLRPGRGKTDGAGQGTKIKLPHGWAGRDLPGAGRLHLRWLLEGTREGQMLDRLLPEPPAAAMPTQTLLRRGSAWNSTFTADLKLANQGNVALAHEGALGTTHVHAGTAGNGGLEDIQRTLDNSVDG